MLHWALDASLWMTHCGSSDVSEGCGVDRLFFCEDLAADLPAVDAAGVPRFRELMMGVWRLDEPL